MKDVVAIEVLEASAAATCRRAALALARDLGFAETRAGDVGIVASELGTNLHRHGGGGELLVRGVACDGVPGVELLALDGGPGLRDPEAALRDGYSTGGGLGGGLGAVRRLSSSFDLYAPPGCGTAVYSRLWARSPAPPPPRREVAVGAVSVPLRGEDVCGDAWHVEQAARRVLVLVVDGLGHGPLAADAAAVAVEEFRRLTRQGPAAVVPALDVALKNTRGAALAVAELRLDEHVVEYAGLGNVCARLVSTVGSNQLVGDDGIAGALMRRTHARTYEFPAGSLLVLHSDGVRTGWKAADYADLWAHHPVLIAAVLYRDHARRRDDATVVVAAWRMVEP